MFGVSGFEFVILAVLALLVFGPERLPSIAADAGRMIRQLRKMAQDAREEVSGAFPELEDLGLADLDPRQFVRRQLLEEKDDLDAAMDGRPKPATNGANPVAPAPNPKDLPAAEAEATPPPASPPVPSPWDADAT